MTASLHARPWWPRSAASWGFPVVVAATSPRTGDLGWSAGALAGGEPFTLRTTAYGASVTKQIVAALAARAVLDGGLDPESGVREHLPELPPWAAAIRVRHLVHHTGGLPQPPVLATALGYPAGPAGWAMLDNSGVGRPWVASRHQPAPRDAPTATTTPATRHPRPRSGTEACGPVRPTCSVGCRP